MEHGCYNMETVAGRPGRQWLDRTVIRVPRLETFFISRVLDAGAEGFMVPMTSTREDAETIVRFGRYAPIGLRGMGGTIGMNERYAREGC